jgi:hypothetical protein
VEAQLHEFIRSALSGESGQLHDLEYLSPVHTREEDRGSQDSVARRKILTPAENRTPFSSKINEMYRYPPEPLMF